MLRLESHGGGSVSDPASLEISEQEIAKEFLGFTVTPPLPRQSSRERAGFTDSWAEDQYGTSRLDVAENSMMTHHLLDRVGDVVGFVAYHLQKDDLGDQLNSYVSVDAIYIEGHWHGRGLSRLLLGPVRCAVASALQSAEFKGRTVSVHCDSPHRSIEGKNVLRSLRRDLISMNRSQSNVTFVGATWD